MLVRSWRCARSPVAEGELNSQIWDREKRDEALSLLPERVPPQPYQLTANTVGQEFVIDHCILNMLSHTENQISFRMGGLVSAWEPDGLKHIADIVEFHAQTSGLSSSQITPFRASLQCYSVQRVRHPIPGTGRAIACPTRRVQPGRSPIAMAHDRAARSPCCKTVVVRSQCVGSGLHLSIAVD